MKRSRWFRNDSAPIILLILLAIIVANPIFNPVESVGGSDWDTHLTYNLIAKKSIAEYGQFPLWNPYECGGMPLLAHPESLFLTPFFIFVMIFGAAVGVKIQILLHLILGLIGMYYLARHLDLKREGSFLAAAVFMFSSVFPLHIIMGHTLWLSVAYIPWTYLFYLKARDQMKWIYLAALSFVLMFFSGSTYIFAFTAVFLGVDFIVRIAFGEKRHIKPLLYLILLVVLLSSVKGLPMMDFLPHTDQQVHGLSDDEGFGYNFSSFFEALTTHPESYGFQEVISGNKYYWFEYSQYIGLLGLVLAAIGLVSDYRKNKKLLVLLLLIVFISFGRNFIINIWSLLHSLPLLSSLKAPSRFNIFIVFILAIFIGKSLERFRDFRWLRWLIMIVLVVQLGTVSMGLYESAFSNPVPSSEENNFSQHINTNPETTHPTTGWSYDMYSFALKDQGTINCYEKIHPDVHAVPEQSDVYKGEAHGIDGPISIHKWTPNRISVDEPSMINQNHDDGWKKAEETSGLIQAKENTIYYLPATFLIGSLISITTIIFIIINSRKKWTRKPFR